MPDIVTYISNACNFLSGHIENHRAHHVQWQQDSLFPQQPLLDHVFHHYTDVGVDEIFI